MSQEQCKNHKRYKGIIYPKCNEGNPCNECLRKFMYTQAALISKAGKAIRYVPPPVICRHCQKPVKDKDDWVREFDTTEMKQYDVHEKCHRNRSNENLFTKQFRDHM